MPWVRIDDGMPDHPRVRPLSDRAFRLYVTAICHSARYLTDGHIDGPMMRTLASGARGRAALDELADAGLIIPSGDQHAIRDYLDYNPSAAQVRERRKKQSKAGKEAAEKRWGNR